jgi:hypothetical protein
MACCQKATRNCWEEGTVGKTGPERTFDRTHSIIRGLSDPRTINLTAAFTNSRRAARGVLVVFPFFYNPKKPRKLPGRAALEFSEIYEKRE